VIEISRVEKRFGQTQVLRGVDLTIARAEVVALLGPSGCGKTTLLRILAGLETPDAGSVSVDGVLLASATSTTPPEKRNIGLVFQDFALFPHLRVDANVAFGLAHLPAPDRASIVSQTLARFDLSDLARRYPHELSGGQQQRVALARALAPTPRVLLMDEPFSNLDTSLRRRLRVELRHTLRQIGIATVFVTHDQDEALSVSDRLVVMSAGRIEQIGTPRDIYERPASAFVADFMGFTNLVPVTIDGPGRGTLKSGMKIRIDGVAATPSPRMLALRAEHLTLTSKPASEALNTAAGIVEALIYRGSFVDYTVRLDDATSLQVRGQSQSTFAPGERTYVAWSPSAGALVEAAA